MTKPEVVTTEGPGGDVYTVYVDGVAMLETTYVEDVTYYIACYTRLHR